MGNHKITLGHEGVTEIGFLVDEKICALRSAKEDLSHLWPEKPYWKRRVAEIETEIKKFEGYQQMVLGAKTITIEHHVDVLAEEKE